MTLHFLKDEFHHGSRLVVLLLVLSCGGCLHSPRSAYFPERQANETIAHTQNRPPGPAPERFRDTSFQRIIPKSKQPLQSGFDAVQADFDDRHYDAALKGCQQFIETLDEADSLQQEARFLAAECRIQKGQMSEARELLSGLVHQKTGTEAVLERSLLRLGQVFCLQNKYDEAMKTFAEFKQRFPSSIFLGLAGCDQSKR